MLRTLHLKLDEDVGSDGDGLRFDIDAALPTALSSRCRHGAEEGSAGDMATTAAIIVDFDN